jgi:pyrimidine deaminase RibD-like protein
MDYMARALLLASRALGTVSPNPAVGAVLVRDGQVVGEGATQPPGEAHAEVVALRAAGALARGATLYVTLEPCAHYGRTPPCADAIVEAGVSETHVAMLDPSPWVDGHGIAVLERAGIIVRRGAHELDALRLNAGYFTWLQRGRPLVTAMYALGLNGQPQPVSAQILGATATVELARLRATADRTVTDVGELLAADPTLAGLAAGGVTALNVEAPPSSVDELARRGLLDRLAVFLIPLFGQTPSVGRPEAPIPETELQNRPNLSTCFGMLSSIRYERLGEIVLIRGIVPGSGADLAAHRPGPATAT